MTASPRQRPALMAVAGAVLILGLALLLLRTLPPVQRWFFGKDSPVTYWRAQDRQALPALWEVIHSRLDLYHRIATSQARRSFVAAQSAIFAGFGLLVAFAVLAVRAQTTASAVTAGALGAVSAALGGFIGRTFIRSQESAAAHLRAYFDQPLEFPGTWPLSACWPRPLT